MVVVERFSNVMHTVSHIEGRLRQGLGAYDLVRATFPAGTLSGAPKIRAMEIIEELEGTRRGLYGGAVGYFSYSGGMGNRTSTWHLSMRVKTCQFLHGARAFADSAALPCI